MLLYAYNVHTPFLGDYFCFWLDFLFLRKLIIQVLKLQVKLYFASQNSICIYRTVPERVYPFSRGVCRNLYNFCCARTSITHMERLPTTLEIEEMSRPYTSCDFLTCRCCWAGGLCLISNSYDCRYLENAPDDFFILRWRPTEDVPWICLWSSIGASGIFDLMMLFYNLSLSLFFFPRWEFSVHLRAFPVDV